MSRTHQNHPVRSLLRIGQVVNHCLDRQRFEFRALSTQVITSQLRQIADAEGIAIAEMALKAIARLLKHGTLQEFALIPPWRTDLIMAAIAHEAKAMSLILPKDVLLYLAEAIGNDTARIASELQKLAVDFLTFV